MKSKRLEDSAIGVAAWLVPLALTFVCTPLIVRGLGAKQYGLYALLSAFSIYSIPLGVNRALLRFAREADDSMPHAMAELLRPALIATSLIAVTNVLLMFLIAPLIMGSASLAWGALVPLSFVAIAIGASTALQLLSAVPQAVDRMALYGKVTMAISAIAILGGAIIVSGGGDWVTLLGWQALTLSSGALGMMFVARRLLPDHVPSIPARPWTKRILGFAIVVGLPQLFGSALAIGERSMIGKVVGGAAVGHYALAMIVTQMTHSIVSSGSLIFPILASRANEADLAHEYEQALRIALFVSVLGAINLMVCGPLFLRLWIGPELARHVAPIVVVLAPPMAVTAALVIPWTMAEARGYPTPNTWLTLSWVLSSAIVAGALLQRVGTEALAWGRLCSIAFAPLYVAWIERRTFGQVRTRFWYTAGWRLATATMASALVMEIIVNNVRAGWLGLMATSFAGTATFSVAAFASGYYCSKDVDSRSAAIPVPGSGQ